jgi:ABC-type nitrate/sulfonate/bicarbonate transport system substrate-binding protein
MDANEVAKPSNFSRRAFLGTGLKVAGGAAMLGLAPGLLDTLDSSVAGAATQSMAYQLSWVKDAEFAGSFVAASKGYYKAHGLNVNILAGGASVTPEPVVVSGKALVASSEADSVAQAIAQGAALKIIGVRYQKNPFCIVSLAKSPITTPEGLYGKKLGVSAANQVPWQTFVKVAKLDVSKIDVVPVQFDPTPLATGEVDAWMGFITDEPGELEVKGVKVHTFLFADFGYAIYADVYETLESSLQNNEAELVAFMKAEKQGWTWNFNNIKAGTTIAMQQAKSSGLALNQQLLENKSQEALFKTPYTVKNGLFTMDPADIEANIQTMATGGITATKSMFTNQILEQI